MKKRVALYMRVSTSQQTTETQRHELERYCQRQEWEIVQQYVDEGISGSKRDRPALNRMLADAAKDRWSCLVVYKIDRLARSVPDLLGILNTLRALGKDFCSSTQAIDTGTSYGKMLLTFLAAIAEFERETIIERVKSGIERARAEGVRFGRPRVGFDVRRAVQMKRDGKTWREVAREVGVAHSTLRRVVTPLLKIPVEGNA